MLWERIAPPWRACIEEAWTAYRAGSLPIGAAITDRKGSILARGRNRIFEQDAEGQLLRGHRLAHAEMNALIALDLTGIHPHDCILYTTTEPCPLCTGAVRMMRLRELRYASRDGAAGSVDLLEANAYMRRGEVRVVGPENARLEAVLAAMLVEFALHQNDENTPSWVERLARDVPAGAQLGRVLHASGELREWSADGVPVSGVVSRLGSRVEADGQ